MLATPVSVTNSSFEDAGRDLQSKMFLESASATQVPERNEKEGGEAEGRKCVYWGGVGGKW